MCPRSRSRVVPGVVVVSRYWPPRVLIRDVVRRCFRSFRGVRVYVVEPPSTSCFDWWRLIEELESYHRLHDSRLAVVMVPIRVSVGFLELLQGFCEVLGVRLFLAVITDEAEGRDSRELRGGSSGLGMGGGTRT